MKKCSEGSSALFTCVGGNQSYILNLGNVPLGTRRRGAEDWGEL